MALKKCRECGAELKLRPTSCPLCGADPEAESKGESVKVASEYHDKMRKLREELDRLRAEEAWAS